MNSTVTFADLFNYLEAAPASRCISEGQAVLNANHIILCGIQAQTDTRITLFALCLKTSGLTDVPHELQGSFKILQNGDCPIKIEQVTCSCKAGMSARCKHVAALLFLCTRSNILEFEHLSSTDVSCYWKEKQKIALENYEPAPICSTSCIQERKATGNCSKYEQTVLSEKEGDKILNLLIAAVPDSALAKHRKRRRTTECDNESGNIGSELNLNLVEIAAVLEVVLAWADSSKCVNELESRLPVNQCCQNTYNNLILTNNIVHIALDTLQNKVLWRKQRQFRITGSRCYSLFTYSKNDWHTKAIKYFWSKEFTNKYVEHGTQTENEARIAYKTRNNYQVIEAGLIVSKKHPWLGFTPDGIVMKNNIPIKLLEIKCPFIGRKVEAVQFIHHCNYLKFENNRLILKKRYSYYAQVQIGMALLNVSECDFVVYSSFSQSFLNVIVKFDELFVKQLLKKLQNCYFNNMLHELCR